MPKLPRRNDPASVKTRQAALGLDGDATSFDLAPWASAAESVTGVAVIPVSVAQLRVSLALQAPVGYPETLVALGVGIAWY